MFTYKNIHGDNFHYYILKQKADGFNEMKSFFKQEAAEKSQY
jgi:hypothetical protein